MASAYQSYQQNSVNTASPGELTLMLYNGCLKFINLAKKAIDDKNMEDKNVNLLKAQKIIQELMVTLNMDAEISKNMMTLYDFIHNRLIEANTKNDLAILEEAEGFVTEFRDAWKQAIQLNRQKQFAQSGQA
ncbi:flagellar biosynthesis protein FliS [Cytobacillus firmus]|uniref:flagellar export chaperone FliS n=1 Tax=Cytobacillus firmus TaxID=1399 RepID=UPI00077CBA79|nr:flagellar export chaperone FliS [Cytobacillus firmus]MBG9544731.1 flagellar biosynthesis protein FliS [Cytobacillus firmus]MBG9553990.1 flagellar biosynthesis protein FliS [Cytobacillus firmus]MBG9558478.1 flagellar biosynthesis protein FliS [Cytobacillus firmus]MBG9576979.1 flagellar biosynthesis protein FliS [Cytobacillus firmus]MEC1894369.1 flagellar export chaperone FliS [Cytobacillus firmus]